MRIRILHFTSNADPDPTVHLDAYPDPDSSLQIMAQNLGKLFKYAHMPYILAWHLQMMRIRIHHPYHFDADPDTDPDPTFQFVADSCRSASTTL
jgi:hypothetical protein